MEELPNLDEMEGASARDRVPASRSYMSWLLDFAAHFRPIS